MRIEAAQVQLSAKKLTEEMSSLGIQGLLSPVGGCHHHLLKQITTIRSSKIIMAVKVVGKRYTGSFTVMILYFLCFQRFSALLGLLNISCFC